MIQDDETGISAPVAAPEHPVNARPRAQRQFNTDRR